MGPPAARSPADANRDARQWAIGAQIRTRVRAPYEHFVLVAIRVMLVVEMHAAVPSGLIPKPRPSPPSALGAAPDRSNTVSPVDLIRRIEAGHGEFLLFALTPPRLATDRERVQEIADATVARLRPLGLDGLILYDIDDEAERNPAERPFPFMPTLDPADYLADHLGTWPTPVIVYRAVGKYAPEELRAWLTAQDPARVMTVLVGAAVERRDQARTSLADAQALRREVNPALLLGGVAIPERHSRREDEHLRLLAKQEAGCRFFVTQVVYDLNAAKNLVSDYHYECRARGVSPGRRSSSRSRSAGR